MFKKTLLTVALLGVAATAFAASEVLPSEDIHYDVLDRRDPFIPLIGPGGVVAADRGKAHDFLIEGIIFDPQSGSLALINGEFYKEGDRIGDANLISIFRDRIILQQEDEEKTLWIREELVSEGAKPLSETNQPKPA